MVGNPNSIPNSKIAVINPEDGSLSLPWRLFLQTRTDNAGTVTPADLAALEAAIAAAAATANSAQTDATEALTDLAAALLAAQTALGLTASLLDQASTSAVLANPAGFGFFAGGLMQSGELLGTAVWGNPRIFSGTPQDVARALFPASLNSTITLNAYSGGGRYVAGTINFNHSDVGVISWAPTLSLPPGYALEPNGPVPMDPTLASVRVMAYSS